MWAAGITEEGQRSPRRVARGQADGVEELLVRRVVNGWIATHGLELEPGGSTTGRSKVSRTTSTAAVPAQKRFAEAVRELARVRRLQAPKIIAQLNLAAAQTVVNANGPSGAIEKV